MENIISELEEKLLDMHRLIDDLNIQVEQWKGKIERPGGGEGEAISRATERTFF